jgi:hypothetical protein
MEHYHYSTLQALKERVTFLPGSWDKRFVRDLSALGPWDVLTPKQIQQIERLAFRYRKQLNRRGFVIPLEVLEPYYERRRREPTPESIKNHWVNT